MAENLEVSAEGDIKSERRVGSSLRAIDVVAEANGRLTTNVDETLLLHDLMLSLNEI